MLTSEQAQETLLVLLRALGTPEDLALIVAEALRGANLEGHDSHGMLRMSKYSASVREGRVHPQARAEVVRRHGATACVSARWGWGQPAARLAAQTASEIAGELGVGAVVLQDSPHIGRLADYVELIAAEGRIGMALTNTGAIVAPFGGRERRLGTDPIAFAIPRARGRRPLMVDFATSVIAEGKVRVAAAAGQPVPPGSVIDREGAPSEDPQALFAGGALLTAQGHKGYGLAVAIEALGGAMSGMGPAMIPDFGHGNGAFMLALEIEAFAGVARFARQIEEMAESLKSSAPMPGATEVLLPGEPEQRSAERRLREGIPVAEPIWAELSGIADELGVTLPVPVAAS